MPKISIPNWPYFIRHSIELGNGLTWEKDFPTLSLFMLHDYKVVPETLKMAHWIWSKDQRIRPPETGKQITVPVYLYTIICGPLLGNLMRGCMATKCVNPWHHKPSKRVVNGRRPGDDYHQSVTDPTEFDTHTELLTPPGQQPNHVISTPIDTGMSKQDLNALVDRLDMIILERGAKTMDHFLDHTGGAYTEAEIRQGIELLTPRVKAMIQNDQRTAPA